MKADTFEKLVSGVPMLDEREKEGWNPGKSLFQEEEYPVTLLCGREETIPEKKEYSLDGTWEMAEGGTEEERIAGGGHWADSMDANVPCSVHTALFEAGKIPDKSHRIPLRRARSGTAGRNPRRGFRAVDRSESVQAVVPFAAEAKPFGRPSPTVTQESERLSDDFYPPAGDCFDEGES